MMEFIAHLVTMTLYTELPARGRDKLKTETSCKQTLGTDLKVQHD